MKKFPQDFYSDEEFFKIAWYANYFAAFLFEELGEDQFFELLNKTTTSLPPDGETFISTWLVFSGSTNEDFEARFEDVMNIDIHTPNGEPYEGDEVLH